MERVGYWLVWFQQWGGIAVDAVVQRTHDAGASVEKFSFDGPGVDDWVALTRY